MADTFLNNQEVTAEELNNIAIDLGYADYSYFPEEPPQSAVSALNQITADLTGAGILQIGNKCSVAITGQRLIVQDGVCVFASGAKKRLENAVTVDFIDGGTNYLYFLNNISGNTISLINSLTAPITGDFVMLAEISEDKIVRQRRSFSRAKINKLGLNLSTDTVFTQTDMEYFADEKMCIIGQVQDVELSKYNYAIMYDSPETEGKSIGVFDLENNDFVVKKYYRSANLSYGGQGVPWYTRTYLEDKVEIIDGVLSIVTDKEYPTFPSNLVVKFV